MTASTDVVIVGAGPTGLLLAGDLAAAGVSVTVLERRPEHENNLTRAFAVHARTLEVLDARGLADELLARGTPRAAAVPAPAASDLAGCRAAFRSCSSRRSTRWSAARAARPALGAADHARRRGDRISGRTTTASTSAHRDARTGARPLRRRRRRRPQRRPATRWGQPFPGRAVSRSVMLADVRLAEQPPDVLTANADGDTFGFVAPFGDGWYRVIAWNRARQLPDDAPVDLDEVREVPGQASEPTTACTTPAGSRGSTATSGRSRATAWAGSSWPATPRTCTARRAARA